MRRCRWWVLAGGILVVIAVAIGWWLLERRIPPEGRLKGPPALPVFKESERAGIEASLGQTLSGVEQTRSFSACVFYQGRDCDGREGNNNGYVSWVRDYKGYAQAAEGNTPYYWREAEATDTCCGMGPPTRTPVVLGQAGGPQVIAVPGGVRWRKGSGPISGRPRPGPPPAPPEGGP